MTNEMAAAVIGGSAGAVVGAAAAYVLGFLQVRLDRRRRRRSLATVMLAELASLDVTARFAYQYPKGTFPDDAFRALDLVTEALDVFKPTTVTALLDVNSALTGARELVQRVAGPNSPAVMTVAMARVQLLGCVQAIPALKRALESEGARRTQGATKELPASATPMDMAHPQNPPPLPPSPF